MTFGSLYYVELVALSLQYNYFNYYIYSEHFIAIIMTYCQLHIVLLIIMDPIRGNASRTAASSRGRQKQPNNTNKPDNTQEY